MISRQAIEEAKKRLIKALDPLEIYLFGSYAWGQPRENSDLDLAVIVDEDVIDKHKMLIAGHRELFDLEFSKDLIILTKQEFETYSQDVTRLSFKIRHRGIKIYAKA